MANVQDVDAINNIIFNYRGVATHVSDTGPPRPPSRRINVINNVYRAGRDSSGPALQIQNVFHADAQLFFGGNQNHLGQPIDYVDNRRGTSNPAALVGMPNPRPDAVAINIQLPEEIWDTLLDNVGARVPVLDEADALAIAQVRDGSGTLVDCVDKEDQADSVLLEPCVTESALGRWPVYQSVSRPADFDTDGDGMPDDWEARYGLDPDDPADRNGDMVGDGWTNLEYYLNQLAGDYQGTEPVNNAPPMPSFGSSCIDLVCSFLDTSTDGDGQIITWAWDFGDGNGSSKHSPVHTYTAAGTYIVSVSVSDDGAATSDPISGQITVSEPVSDEPPLAEDDVATSDPVSEQTTVSAPIGNEPLAEDDATISDPVSEQTTVSAPIGNEPLAEDDVATSDPISEQIQALIDQVNRLQRELSTLQLYVYRGETPLE